MFPCRLVSLESSHRTIYTYNQAQGWIQIYMRKLLLKSVSNAGVTSKSNCDIWMEWFERCQISHSSLLWDVSEDWWWTIQCRVVQIRKLLHHIISYCVNYLWAWKTVTVHQKVYMIFKDNKCRFISLQFTSIYFRVQFFNNGLIKWSHIWLRYIFFNRRLIPHV